MAKYEEPLDLDKLLDGLTLAKLQKVFDAVMKRNANKLDPVRSRFSTIRREPISLEQKVKSVLSYAREHRHFKFSDVLERESDRLGDSRGVSGSAGADEDGTDSSGAGKIV